MSTEVPLLADTLSVVAHTSKGRWAPEGDDRWLVDRDLGLLYVANGSGPTYGGYHAPFGLDPGLDALREAFLHSPDSGRARLLGAVAAAHARMRLLDEAYQRAFAAECVRSPGDRLGAALRAADAVRPQRWRDGHSYCHFAGAITACSLQTNGAFWLAQVGDGRAYLMRDGGLRLLIEDHTLPTTLARSTASAGDPTYRDALTYHRHVVTRLLGMGETLEPDHSQEWLAPGDTLLLCTAGVWNHEGGDDLVPQLMAATPDEIREILKAGAQSSGHDATAVRVSV